MNAEDFEDIPIEANGADLDPIDPGTHIAACVGWKTEDKPQWKLDQQRAQHPEKEPDPRQWAITFEISDGEFEGRRLTTWENRTWHEKGKAAQIAAALLGVDKLEADGSRNVRQLMGLRCQILVIEKSGKNYVKGALPMPRRRRDRGGLEAVTPKQIEQLRPTYAGGQDDEDDLAFP